MASQRTPLKPLVGIIMGSQSDWETMQHAAAQLDALGVPYETEVVSAHRTPDRMFEYAQTAAARGLEIIIAGAGRDYGPTVRVFDAVTLDPIIELVPFEKEFTGGVYVG